MRRGVTSNNSIWRRLVARALIFALVAHWLMFAVANAAGAANSPVDPLGLDIQICRHDTSGMLIVPTNTNHSDQSSHCIFCIAGSTHIFAVPTPALATISFVIEQVRWSFIQRHGPAYSPRNPNIGPRGPPLTA